MGLKYLQRRMLWDVIRGKHQDFCADTISQTRAFHEGKGTKPHGLSALESTGRSVMYRVVWSRGHRFHPLVRRHARGQDRFNYSLISKIR